MRLACFTLCCAVSVLSLPGVAGAGGVPYPLRVQEAAPVGPNGAPVTPLAPLPTGEGGGMENLFLPVTFVVLNVLVVTYLLRRRARLA